MSRFDSLSVSTEKRRNEVGRDAQNAASLRRVTYTILVTGAGETTVNVAFPVAFVERPDMWEGGAYLGVAKLDPANEWTTGNMPVYSIIVLAWEVDPVRKTYTGATLGIVTGGAADDNFELQAHFESRTLDRPRG